MIKKIAYISIIIIFLVGCVLGYIDTIWSRLLMEFCYVAFGWWIGYAMAGGFDE
jgi:hypothetical protein